MASEVKKLDALDMRVVDVVKVGDESTETGIIAQIEVSASLPFIQVEDDFIDRTSYFTYKQDAGTKEDITETITDLEYLNEFGVDRFIYMGMVRAPQTENAIRFYYDRKYKDIFLTPDINFLKVTASPGVYLLSGYCVGKLSLNGDVTAIDETVPVNQNSHRNLPEAADEATLLGEGGLQLDSCFVTGTNKSLWYKSLEIAKTLNDGTQLNTTQVDVINIVTLGLPEVVFGDANVKLPHHLLYQYSPIKHMIKPQGWTPMTTKIRVAVRV